MRTRARGPADTTPPTVLSITPSDDALGVLPTTAIVARFSEDIDVNSVTTSTFYIQGITGSVSASGDEATFTPDQALGAATQYIVVIEGIRDLAGNPLESSFSSKFTTALLPVADAGASIDANRGETVMLDGTASTSPSGGALTYTWTQMSGAHVGALSGATPNVTAPEEIGSLVFQLVVTADGIDSALDFVTIMVLEDKNIALFVHPSGLPSNVGTRSDPIASVQAAMDAAVNARSDAYIYVVAGSYSGTSTFKATSAFTGVPTRTRGCATRSSSRPLSMAAPRPCTSPGLPDHSRWTVSRFAAPMPP